MKKVLLALLLLTNLVAAEENTKPKRNFEIYFGGTYDLYRDSALSRSFSITGFGGFLGYYQPIFDTYAISYDISFDAQMSEGSHNFSQMIHSVWITKELDLHRISLGLKLYPSMDINYYDPSDPLASFNNESKLTLGYALSYDYLLDKSLPMYFGLQFQSITFYDINNAAYPDNSIKAVVKLRISGWDGLVYFFTGHTAKGYVF